jgi:CrcB protein
VPNWKLLAVVTVGGGLGSVARFLVTALVQPHAPNFPAATFIINVVGSYLIGLFAQMGLDTAVLSPEARFFLTTGFCGGFTTFSTFSYETLQLVEENRYSAAAVYIGASVLLAFTACVLGVASAKSVVAWRRA